MEHNNNQPVPTSPGNQQLADYAMTFDLVSKIAKVTTEEKVIEKTFELFTMLCAPSSMTYLQFINSEPGGAFFYPSTPFDYETRKKRLIHALEGAAWTASDSGFILRICLDDTTMGIIEIEGIAFIQYKEHYLNLGINLAGVIALAISNARYYQDLVEAKERVHNQNAVLEGINRIFLEALAAHTEEELGRRCLAIAEEVTQSNFGFIGEIGPDGFLHDIAISNPGWELCAMHDKTGHRRPPGNFTIHGIYGRVLIDGEGFFTNDPPSHPDSVGTPEGHPALKAFLGVPLFHAGKNIGMVGMGNREGGYRTKDLEALEALGSAIVQTFMRKRAEQELATLNRELEAFTYSASHDLRAPLRHIESFSSILQEEYEDKLGEEGKDFLLRIRTATLRMGRLIDDLLELSRVSRNAMTRKRVNLSELVKNIIDDIVKTQPKRKVRFIVEDGLVDDGDEGLLFIALQNLLENAWKFTGKREEARIEFGAVRRDGKRIYFVKDNGAGFDMAHTGNLFKPFQRLHNADEFAGTGIGLATVHRIIQCHGGRIWAEGEVGKVATIYFTLI